MGVASEHVKSKASSRVAPSRSAALAVTSERRRRGAWARELLRNSSVMEGIDDRDRALATRLVLGSVAAEGELDRVIDSHLARTVKLEPRVRDALRLATFEILYLETPDSVCVSQGVELVRSVAPRASGLANAVLRHVTDEDVPALAAAASRIDGGDFGISDLARVGALPEWLCEGALASLGSADAVQWARGALAPAGPAVAANRARVSSEEAERLLAEAGCEPKAGPVPGSFVLGKPAALAPSGLVKDVSVLPCDLAAQEVAQLCAPEPGARVLEVGQGRGTKTVLLEGVAVAAGGPCQIVAIDSDASKSAAARRRLRNAGISEHVFCLGFDGRHLGAKKLPNELAGSFDLVLVDAPCTGTGTLSRHPEIAWSLEQGAPGELAALQLELLQASSARVGEGCMLAYSTCSVLAEEDERVVEAFLASDAGAGFELIDERRPHGTDTHFLARMRRR